MKKSLLALAALSAFATAAQAQSSVTVYGIVDVGVSDVESKTAAASPVSTKTKTTGAEGQLSGNRIGFRGVEDLGGGLKAGFVLEMSHTPTEATSGVGATNRQSFLSLSNNMGEVRIGRQNSLNKVINDSGVFGGAGFATGWTTAINGYQAERVSNTIQYETPVFNGLQASVAHQNDSADVSNVDLKTKNEATFIGLRYNQGPLSFAYANKNAKDSVDGITASTIASNVASAFGILPLFRDVTAANLQAAIEAETGIENAATDGIATRKVKQDTVLLGYDFKVAKVVATYNKGSSQVEGAAKAKRDDWVLGVSVPMGKTTLLAQYGDGEQTSASNVKTDIKGYQLGALYSLSKRTTAYALYGDQETKAANSAYKAKADGFAMGVRHSF
jgi:predicted porin